MKTIFCHLGLHDLKLHKHAVVTSKHTCCNEEAEGEIYKCRDCGNEYFKYENGVKVNLQKEHGLTFIPPKNVFMDKQSVENLKEFKHRMDKIFLTGRDDEGIFKPTKT